MRRSRAETPWTTWLMGGAQVLMSMTLALWLLTLPSLFQAYYPALGISSNTRDAAAIVRWLSSSYRERSLNLALSHGRLGTKELRHYSDVRRVFRWFPYGAAVSAAILAAACLVARPTREQLEGVQKRALLLWLALLLAAGALALGDWQLFFAWIHRPLFGDRSWRLPDSAYSLRLFPTAFWRFTTAAVLVAPGLVASLALAGLKFVRPANAGSGAGAATRRHPAVPEEKTPSAP